MLVTDAEGRFRTPKELELNREYMVSAHANGHQFYRTGRAPAHDGGVFAEIKLPADAASSKAD